jgi:hypothetical protein
MKLRWIQRYSGDRLSSPPCEHIDQCGHRAIGMWVDPAGHAHDFCEIHAGIANAPPMIEGVWYAPTHHGT